MRTYLCTGLYTCNLVVRPITSTLVEPPPFST
jgi:hypothetical protein